MKNFTKVVIITVLFISASLSAQEAVEQENFTSIEKTILNVETALGYATATSQWFTGVKQNIETSISKKDSQNSTNSLLSKKEMYLQSGLTNKTLLIRSLLKKADSNTRATV
ncbi:MAG: hypothetical protein ACK4RM_03655 [Flavobacterium sp.]